LGDVALARYFVTSQKVVAKQSGKAVISFRPWEVLIKKRAHARALAHAQVTQNDKGIGFTTVTPRKDSYPGCKKTGTGMGTGMGTLSSSQ